MGLDLKLNSHAMRASGTATPPADMIAAARSSLSPQAFEDLMRRTAGRPPTPDELVAAVEAEKE